MNHYRTDYRTVVAAALDVALVGRGFRRVSAWAQKVDDSQLPCFGVATPGETSSREGGDTVHRVTTVQVAARIAGDEDGIEAALDELSLTIEAAVLPALDPVSHIVALSTTGTTVDAGGQRRLGILIMNFSVTRFTDAASQT